MPRTIALDNHKKTPRRMRLAKNGMLTRQPKGIHVPVTEADKICYHELHTFGILDSRQLYHATRHIRRNKDTHLKSLNNRYHEAAPENSSGSYLDFPKEQTRSYLYGEQPYAYENGLAAIDALERFGILPPFIGVRRDPKYHRYCNASELFWIKYAARDDGVDFRSRSEILSHPKANVDPNSELPISLKLKYHETRKYYEPDDLFGLTKKGKGTFFFIKETDCGNEQQKHHNKKTSIEEKFECMVEVIENNIIFETFGIPTVRALITTTSEQRMYNMLKLVEKLTTHRPSLRDQFLFKSKGHLGSTFWLAAPEMPDLYTDPWTTLNGLVFINQF